MRTLFVCTANTCRSPLAERLARMLWPEHSWESAGVLPDGWMHPLSERVIAERGGDAGDFEGRDVMNLELGGFDHLVLIGETARNLAPDPPQGVSVHYWDVPDPFLAQGSMEYVLETYRACADDLVWRIAGLLVEDERRRRTGSGR